jgi:hypothetical protein
MPLWLAVPFAAFEILAFVFAFRANLNLVPGITDPFIELSFRRGLFRRELFTERGWRYRNIAMTCHACGFATLLVWLVWSQIGR